MHVSAREVKAEVWGARNARKLLAAHGCGGGGSGNEVRPRVYS